MFRRALLIALIGAPLCLITSAQARHPGHGEAGHTQETISDRDPDRHSPITGVTSWKAALHMHGCLSEGSATTRSHHEVAKLQGIDVIWWTDHDHMIVDEAHRATRFSFDALTEPLNQGEPWVASSNADITLQKSATFFRSLFDETSALITTTRAAQGTGSLRMSGRRVLNNRQSFMYLFNAEGTRRKYCLASGVTVRIKVFPEVAGPEATGVVTMILSRPLHPSIVSTQRLEIQYYLSNGGEPPVRQDNIYRVPVPYVPNQWNELILPVTQDAIAGYPFINGEDNSLTELLFGLESRNNALAVCYYDDLRVDLDAVGETLFQWQRAELDAYNALNEGVRHHQGIEHSYSPRHMLEYGPNTPLPDWNAYETLSPGFINGWLVNWQAHHDFIGYRISELGHQRGAAISYAHPFGTGTALNAFTLTKEQLLANLLANRAYNSDLLEVGYRQRERPMADHLWVWDQLALHGVYLSGLGVSDSHGADINEILTDPTFSMTQFIYAEANDESSLAESLRAGRTYYGDPVIFDGEMDIESDSGAVMGNVVVTDRPTVNTTVRLRGLASGDQVRIIDSGVLASTTPVTGDTADVPAAISVNPVTGSFVRAEVYSQISGRAEKAFSNPIYFVAQVPDEGIDWRRAAIDVLNITSRKFDHFRLEDLDWSVQGASTIVNIEGRHDGTAGEIELDVSRVNGSVSTEFSGALTGSTQHDGQTLRLFNLQGDGSVTIRIIAGCPADRDGDGAVEVDDLNAVLASWQTAVTPFTSGDTDGNGIVDVEDLNTVLSNWGLQCP